MTQLLVLASSVARLLGCLWKDMCIVLMLLVLDIHTHTHRCTGVATCQPASLFCASYVTVSNLTQFVF